MGAEGSRTAALNAGVHVGLVIVADVGHIVATLEHARVGTHAYIEGAAISSQDYYMGILAFSSQYYINA